MKAISNTALIFVVGGWLAFSIAIGFAVAGAAGTLAGVIAGSLAIFLTAATLINLVYNLGEVTGCFGFAVGIIWLVVAVIATGALLGISMSSGWAALLAVLLGVAWILAVAVYFVTNK